MTRLTALWLGVWMMAGTAFSQGVPKKQAAPLAWMNVDGDKPCPANYHYSKIYQPAHGTKICDHDDAQPVDVPPIREEYGKPGVNFCDMGSCTWMDADPSHPNALTPTPHRRTRLTCADRTRFLMTAEDGSKHCIALSPAKEGSQ